jgi:hypothetical protein
MSLTKYIKDLGRVVAYYPSLKKITYSTTASILLCQLLYWTDKTDDGWIKKTSDDIEEETGLTYNEQRTARICLRDLGLVEDVYKRLDHEIWFKVNQDVLNEKWEERGGEKTMPIVKEKPQPKAKKKTEVKPRVSEEEQAQKEEMIGEIYPRQKDWLDAALGNDAQKANKIYEEKRQIREKIEKKLSLTEIGENVRWMKFVDFAYRRLKEYNEDVDIFLNWTLHNEAYDPAYWTPEKMKTLWGQAFSANKPDKNFVKTPEIEEEKKDFIELPKDFGKTTKAF